GRRWQLSGCAERPAPADEGHRRLDRQRRDGDVQQHLGDEERVRQVEADALGIEEEPQESGRQREQRRGEEDDVQARQQPYLLGFERRPAHHQLGDEEARDEDDREVVQVGDEGFHGVDPVAETRWLASVRRRHGRPTVAVAHAALERDDAEAVLAAHAAFDFVRGIRQKPEPGQMSDARWRRGYAWLARHRLSYDLQAPCGLFAEAAALARDFPDTPIVVNHTGLPVDRSEAGLAAWRRALETVAAPPNVALKISG